MLIIQKRALGVFRQPSLTFCPLCPTVICPHDNFFVYADHTGVHPCSVVNGEIVNTATGYPLPDRSQARTTPLSEQRFSPLLCTINAYHKFTRFSKLYPDLYRHLPERIRTLSDRVQELHGLMMWTPDGHSFTAAVIEGRPAMPANVPRHGAVTRSQGGSATSAPAWSTPYQQEAGGGATEPMQLEAGVECSDSESADSWDDEGAGTGVVGSEIESALVNLGSSNQEERVTAFAALTQQIGGLSRRSTALDKRANWAD
jgi:hypothetical protein